MCTAEAGQPVVVLVVKLVIVGKLFAAIDPPVCENDNVQVTIDFHDFGDAVGVARVVDVPSHVAGHGGVQHAIVVEPEHVDSAILFGVMLLANVGEIGPDDLADVLDDHLMFFDVASSVEAQPLNSRSCQNNILPPFLLHFSILRTLGLNKIFGVRSGRFEPN